MTLPDFPRFRLAHLPTPLERLERLRKHLNGPRLFMKRDDCTGLALGGNKTRKLEFLIGDALNRGATAVITEGGVQSNHVRQTAAAAAKAGLKCHLALDHRVPIDTSIYCESGNFLLDRLLGATAHLCGPNETRASVVTRVTSDLRSQGEVPYVIPTGGSNEIGALGYVLAARELLQQANEADISIDHVVAAASSGGTQAGLIAGMAIENSDVLVTGIDVEGDDGALTFEIENVTERCAERIGLAAGPWSSSPRIERGYAGEGYGIPTVSLIEAINLTATLEGILLDPVYTGKAMAGLIGMIRSGAFATDQTIVFIHSGGAPALFAYADRVLES